MFRVTQWLLAAKTSVKEPVKQKSAAKKVVKAQKVIDLEKFQHSKWVGNNLVEIVRALPQPAKPDIADRATWLHKNGFGLKFYRESWTRYPEPCYWTLAKWKSKTKRQIAKAWGFRTWRGVTEPLPREVTGMYKREWRILVEPGTKLGPSEAEAWVAPEIHEDSDPRESTQLPEGLKGTRDGTWPYPWGKAGLKMRLGSYERLVTADQIAAAEEHQYKLREQRKDGEEVAAAATNTSA